MERVEHDALDPLRDRRRAHVTAARIDAAADDAGSGASDRGDAAQRRSPAVFAGASLRRRNGPLAPLSLAAYVTWLGIAAAVLDRSRLLAGDPREWAGATCLLLVLGAFALRAWYQLGGTAGVGLALLQALAVLGADVALQDGQVAVLLIVVAGQLVLLMPLRRTVACLLLLNLALAAIWSDRAGSAGQLLLWLLPMLAFQAFAGLIGHYAGQSELAREHLAQVNAELIATQRLLEESTRDGERLKLSRELHDVAGHKLTALKLNLARLARDPQLGAREDVALSRQLADELLEDIRGVVGALRRHDGLDLRAALDALARPVAGTDILIEMAEPLRLDELRQAETLLRCAQEGITNALRHGRATQIRVRCERRGDTIALSVHDDGAPRPSLRFGNGLTGMRERLAELGGSLQVQALQPRGVALVAKVPGRPA